jgi:hypothetical protein
VVPSSFPQCCASQVYTYIASSRGGKREHVNVRVVEHIILPEFFFNEMRPTFPPSRLKDFSLFKENDLFIITILNVFSFIEMKKSLMKVGVDYIVLRSGILYYCYMV